MTETLRKAVTDAINDVDSENFMSNREGWCGGNLTDEPQPRRMTGFFATLTEEQRKAALNYRGDDTHGDKYFMSNREGWGDA